jgi:hypothetical protein
MEVDSRGTDGIRTVCKVQQRRLLRRRRCDPSFDLFVHSADVR